MQLFLDTYGIHLGVRDGQFLVKSRHHEGRQFAVREVNAVFMSQGGSLTTDALRLALEHAIPIILLDAIGHPLGLWWNGRFGSTPAIRRNQARLAESVQGLEWLTGWLGRKVAGQRQLLQQLGKGLAGEVVFEKKLARAMPVINHVANSFSRFEVGEGPLDFPKVHATFRGLEGAATKQYFRCIALALPQAWVFEERSFRPAKDGFNALLNYLYGILYAQVEVALIKAGVDPAMPVFHAPQYNRPAMVYDFIEPFRCWADEVAVSLCREGKVGQAGLVVSEKEGVLIGQEAKGVVVAAWFQFLNEKILHNGSSVRRIMVLDVEAVSFSSFLKKIKFP